MITFSCQGQNVRTLDIGGTRWIAAPDALRVLGVDIARKGASVHLQTLPQTEVRLVTSSEYPLRPTIGPPMAAPISASATLR
jgi:prophage antirepressor-like protein